jgi:tetratricopeptide (TPR) repeat protein
MPKRSIARRAKLVGFVALASAMEVLNGSLTRPDAAFGRVCVDVSSLRADVGDPTASWVSEELPGALAQALARVGRAGVPVIVRIHSVILGPSSGGQRPNNASQLTEYAYVLAKADRYQEALDLLDMIDNPNAPRALNYRGHATRKLGRTEDGIGYYLKSVALDPQYPQVREYLGEAYVIEGKYDLAKEQLATNEKLCGSKDCEYYEDIAEALEKAHAL